MRVPQFRGMQSRSVDRRSGWKAATIILMQRIKQISSCEPLSGTSIHPAEVSLGGKLESWGSQTVQALGMLASNLDRAVVTISVKVRRDGVREMQK